MMTRLPAAPPESETGNSSVQMTDSNNIPIKHRLVYTNAVACGAFFGMKTGAAEANVLKVDYVTAWQKR